MSTWLSEKEFRQSGAESAGVTINVAFLRDIKEDFGFRNLLNEVYFKLNASPSDKKLLPRVVAELLGELRDELETYFALEEFYGYFKQAAVSNPIVSQKAIGLSGEHEMLYLQLSGLVESAQQIVYREVGPEVSVHGIVDGFEEFCIELAAHEQAEMELMMRLHNEEFGVGD